MTAQDKTTIRRSDIIEFILLSNIKAVENCIVDDPNAINSIETKSGMNAAMLCIYGGLPKFFDLLIHHAGAYLDFSHWDDDTDDLLSIAIGTMNVELIDKVQSAYEELYRSSINNWPQP